MTKKQEKWTVWICKMLGPLLLEERTAQEEAQFLQDLAEKEVVLPSGKSKTLRVRTWRMWLTRYREEGFQGLIRKPRSDSGRPRKDRNEIIQAAIELKKELPSRSDVIINKVLMARFGQTVPRSTIYRHFKEAGATRLKLGLSTKPARKRWTCEHTHDIWVGDFSDGPMILVNGLVVRSYCISFIDKYSGSIVGARYVLNEDFAAVREILVEAIMVHGLPRAFYFDNGKVFHADVLKSLCLRLGCRLYYRPVGEPEPGGQIEKCIQIIQIQFEAEVRLRESLLDLITLNKSLQAWMYVVHDQTANRETGQTPRARYAQGALPLRLVDMSLLKECFLNREIRTVDKTYVDVRIDNRFYKVDLKLRGDKVEVRYDPYQPDDEVGLYTLAGAYLGQGVLHQRQEKRYPQPAVPAAQGPKTDVLGILIDEHESQVQAAREGFNQEAFGSSRAWSFTSFASAWASLVGRHGGISAFNEHELEALQQIHERHLNLNIELLKKAVANAASPSIIAIAHEIQKLEGEGLTPT